MADHPMPAPLAPTTLRAWIIALLPQVLAARLVRGGEPTRRA